MVKKKLLIYQKVSKYYEHGCLQKFLSLFMSLLTALIGENSHILGGIYFIFLKNRRRPTWKAFNTKFGPQWKDRESSYQVRQILAFFCKLVALILDWNCLKGLTVTKIVKQIKFEGVWGELEAKSCFQRQPFAKCLRQTLVFLWNSALREKFNFYFPAVFC